MIMMNKALPYFILILYLTLSSAILFSSPVPSGEYSARFEKAGEIMEDQPEEAIVILRKILRGIDPADNPTEASKANFLMGEAFFYMDELDSTVKYYLIAVDIDETFENDRTPEHINILGNLGYMYDALDKKILALDYYTKALDIARETGLKDEIAANLANIAQIRTIQGFYNEALVAMQEALQIDREIGDESVIAVDLNTIGRIYESWGMFREAADYLEQALAIDRKLGNKDKLAIRYNSLGLVYKGWGKFDIALEYFNKALAIDRQNQRPEKVALRQANIGSTLLDMGNAEEALIHLESSLEYFTDNDFPSYMATTLNDLGRCYLKLKDFDKAEMAFLQSNVISRQHGFARFRLKSLEYLSQLYRQSGRYQEALEAKDEFKLLNDSLFNTESQRKIAEFNALYEIDKKQKENELLVKDRELAKKRQIVMLMTFSILALVLVVAILGLLVRIKGHQNRRLLAEKENEKLKMDLEQRNKELTYNAMCIIKNNETVAKIAETIEDAINSGGQQNDLNQMVRKLQNMEREKNWAEFEIRFTKVHEEFYDKLNTRFPELSPNEKKLCAFLKLNMSSKDIAAITHQSVHSINVARTRLRKKLGIDQTDENLVNFLTTL